MNRGDYLIIFTLMAVLLLTSCAAPQPAKPGTTPSTTPPPPVVQKPADKPSQAAIDKSFQDIEAAKEDKKKAELEHVKNVVNMRQVRLRNIYKEETQHYASAGVLLIKLFIDEKGMMQATEVSIDSGEFSQAFLEMIRHELAEWRFLVKSPVTFAFKIELN